MYNVKQKNIMMYNYTDQFFQSIMYFNSKLTRTTQKIDNIKNIYLHVGQLS